MVLQHTKSKTSDKEKTHKDAITRNNAAVMRHREIFSARILESDSDIKESQLKTCGQRYLNRGTSLTDLSSRWNRIASPSPYMAEVELPIELYTVEAPLILSLHPISIFPCIFLIPTNYKFGLWALGLSSVSLLSTILGR